MPHGILNLCIITGLQIDTEAIRYKIEKVQVAKLRKCKQKRLSRKCSP